MYWFHYFASQATCPDEGGKANFRVFQKADCIPFNSYKIQVVELSHHAGYLPELMANRQQTKPNESVHHVFISWIECLCVGSPPINSWVGGWLFELQMWPAGISIIGHFCQIKFPKAQQTQVEPRDQPVMQECWQQKELMAPRLPKLNIAVCKAQGDLLLRLFFRIKTSCPDWRVLAKNQLRESDQPLLLPVSHGKVGNAGYILF